MCLDMYADICVDICADICGMHLFRYMSVNFRGRDTEPLTPHVHGTVINHNGSYVGVLSEDPVRGGAAYHESHLHVEPSRPEMILQRLRLDSRLPTKKIRSTL